MPLNNTFIAVSFEAIEEAFKVADVAKYAFVYTAQPLKDGVPSFCLACMGTNKFTSDEVLKRWKHIAAEAKTRGITVVSFGADGDSRELKSMKVSTQLLFSSQTPISFLSPSYNLKRLPIPAEWFSWFAVRKATAIAYVQDTVHIAVKLKSRLIKPSIVLPLGKYLAGVHHLHLVRRNFGKDQHGLRERDINHKDRQNYDAVLHITSKSVITLLSQIPDARGTSALLQVTRYVIDSFLDKKLDALSRVEKAWCAVFFMRYWRQWLLLNPNYTLENNFITQNAYMCIELNAHSLITFLVTVRDILPSDSCIFSTWLLGSQSCEKVFRAARSMSTTFSTVINFGMLGLLRRLHRLHIQSCLEAESEQTKIKYPRVEAHKNKDGHHNPNICDLLPDNKQIAEAVERARDNAKEMTDTLGMAEILKKSNCWENPPIPVLDNEVELTDDDDFDDEVLTDNDAVPQLLQESISAEESEDIASDVSRLTSAGIIGKDLSTCLTALKKSSFRRLPGTSLPMFEVDDVASKKKSTNFKHCPYVEVEYNGKTLFINKTTAVWLLQEGERVSSDRLFRVRNKQPYSSDPQPRRHMTFNTDPCVCETIEVGNICVFRDSQKKDRWKIGRVLVFIFSGENKELSTVSWNYVCC